MQRKISIPKLSKRTKIIISVLVILFAWFVVRGQINAYKERRSEEAKMLYEVQRGDLSVEIKVTASARLVNEQKLSFAQEGKIEKVNVQVGDEVKAGDVLAELSMQNYHNAVQMAELDLENAQITLDQLRNNDTSVIEAKLQASIDELELAYANQQDEYSVLLEQLAHDMQQINEEVNQYEKGYLLAKESLQLAESELQTNIRSGTKNYEEFVLAREQIILSTLNSLRSDIGDAENILKSIDSIFGIGDVYRGKSDAYYEYISAKNDTYKTLTKTYIKQAYPLIGKYKEAITGLSLQTNDNELYRFIMVFYDDLELLVRLAESASNALQNSVTSDELTSENLVSYTSTAQSAKASITALRNQILTLASSTNTLLDEALEKNILDISHGQKQLNYENQVLTLAQQRVTLANMKTNGEILERDHQNRRAQMQARIRTTQENIRVFNQELVEIQDGADERIIQQQINLVNQARLRLDRTRDQLDDYQIIADFDGRVRTVDITQGEQYKLEDRAYIVVENPNLIELELQVSQIDIVKIKEGDLAIVTFDAYPNQPIRAHVTSRDINPEPNGRGGVFYGAKILLERGDMEILAGMSSLVRIIADEAKDAIIIPSLSLIQENGKYYVLKKKKQDFFKQEVTVGITNNFQAQILEGLQPGDQIRASVLDEELMQKMGITDESGIGN